MHKQSEKSLCNFQQTTLQQQQFRWTSDAMDGGRFSPGSLQKHSFLSNWISLYVYEKGVHRFVRRPLLQRHAIYPFSDNNVVLSFSSRPQPVSPTLSLLKLENCRSKHRENAYRLQRRNRLNAPYRGQGKESGGTGTLHVAIIFRNCNPMELWYLLRFQFRDWVNARRDIILPHAMSSWGFQRTRNSERKLLFWQQNEKDCFLIRNNFFWISQNLQFTSR